MDPIRPQKAENYLSDGGVPAVNGRYP